ncbi:TOBE domain-containing protein [Klebsiella pasteurii]|uniref:Molybdenum-pterin-binding protein MopA n=1 Tax=Klebsiella pasteurii TaxID=2587529 RepID=A0A9Q9S8L7_9ENTR|nr:TOBE domain-containing protein [Klebsiella pasteurii]VUS59758.1 Molybdenum-pterin-binding protein MopA [Klebsiella pasteurii]VUT11034.1 Molybdenum-pterin-binding protein MopA [Klebsiella pasteurii]
MAISARNQLAGTVSVTERGAINDEVELTLEDGAKLIALVTSGSQQALGLEPGREAIALINNREQSASPSQSIWVSMHLARVRSINCYENGEVLQGFISGASFLARDHAAKSADTIGLA